MTQAGWSQAETDGVWWVTAETGCGLRQVLATYRLVRAWLAGHGLGLGSQRGAAVSAVERGAAARPGCGPARLVQPAAWSPAGAPSAPVWSSSPYTARPMSPGQQPWRPTAADAPLPSDRRPPPPTADHRPPTAAADRRSPTDDRRTDDRRPTTDDRRPTTDDRRPTTDDRRPTTDDRRPTTDDRRPTTDHRPPTAAPTTDDRRQTTDDRRSPTADRTITDRRLPTPDRPTADDRRPPHRGSTGWSGAIGTRCTAKWHTYDVLTLLDIYKTL